MTQIFAHRGSKGTHPENTLAAFHEAVRVKSDGIELDVHLTQDQRLVVIHDETVDRTTNGMGEIRLNTLASLQQLDAGSCFSPIFAHETLPSLDEVLELLTSLGFSGTLNIELKTDVYAYEGIEAQVMQLLNAQQYPFKFILSSFNPETLTRLAKLSTNVELAWIIERIPEDALLHQYLPIIQALHVDEQLFWHAEETLLAYRKKIRLWTINDEVQLLKAYKAKVEAVFTDYPAKAIQLRRL